MSVESDLAVIEISTNASGYTEWEPLMYIGPDRAEGEPLQVDGLIRIRYLPTRPS
jgi:hypothetical protein